VAFPDEILADDEEVVLHLHPHGKRAVFPGLLLLLAVVVTAGAWVMLPTTRGGRTAFAVVALIMGYQAIRYAVRPLVIWRCTHYVFTDSRVLLQDGVIARERRDLPLNRVNDHVVKQSLVDRLFNSGTMTIDSIGDQAVVLTGVPHIQHVQTVLYELIESLPEDDEDDEIEDDEPELPAQRRMLFRRETRG
jgi:uncharacterized membrane protein YdbT with pleckstrin-like domain